MDEQDKHGPPSNSSSSSSSQQHSLNNEAASKALASSSTTSNKITSSTSIVGSSTTTIDVHTVKVMGEMIGVSNLQDEPAKVLADDVTYRVKVIIQDALKFMEQGKRQKLSSQDIDSSLKVKNMEPSYGFQAGAGDGIPFRFVSGGGGGGLDLHFVDEKEVKISELLAQPLPKVPLEPSLRVHWLAIEGVQPAVPENPPPPPPQPCSMDLQRVDDYSVAVDPSRKQLKYRQGSSQPPGVVVGKPIQFKTSEPVFIKQLATHQLSAEQQLYYKEIVEACIIGSDEMRRIQALGSLTNDPGLFELVPKFVTFIAEGVRINVGQFNLVFLIYLMRMVKALLENPTLALERYLHEIIPSVATCIVTKQLCLRLEVDNHWALRDYSAKLMSHICKTYTNTTNNIQGRVTRIFCSALKQQEEEENNKVVPLSSVYGALVGLGELGPEVIRALIFPKVKEIGTRLEFCFESSSVGQSPTIDKTARIMIKQLLGKLLTPVLKSTRSGPDILDEYKKEFGHYFGPMLYTSAVNLRSQELKQSSTSTTTTTSTSVPSNGV